MESIYLKGEKAMSQPNPQPAAKTDQTFWIYLSYLLHWILGIIALATVKDDDRVRFQCAQALALSAVFCLGMIALAILSGIFVTIAFGLWRVFSILYWLLVLAYYVYAIYLVYLVSQGKDPRIPILGDFAEKNLVKLFK